MAKARSGREWTAGGTGEEQSIVLAGSSGDPQFLHAVLCQLGLPRNPTASRTFERTSGRASLSLQAGRTYDGLKWVNQPLPSGTRPRLVLINLCSEAVRTRCDVVDIGGSVREFLRRLNIDAGGESMAQFRKQMLALSSCHMTLAYGTASGTTQVDAKPIDAFQAWHTNEEGQQALWPGYIRLTDKFFESLMEHAVPLRPEAIGQLQNSAFALDVYSWLAHRLCRVNERGGIVLSWAALKGQFGQEYAATKNFKLRFVDALTKACSVYKEAKIEMAPGGLRLLPSPPPVPRKRVALPATATADDAQEREAASPLAIADARALPLRDPFAFSDETLQRLAIIAPGWNRQWLIDKFEAMRAQMRNRPGELDEKFTGWVRAFTRGRDPGESSAAAPPESETRPEIQLTEATLAEAQRIAPGWPIEKLVRLYLDWVREQKEPTLHPQRAFLGWVRKFTKGAIGG